MSETVATPIFLIGIAILLLLFAGCGLAIVIWAIARHRAVSLFAAALGLIVGIGVLYLFLYSARQEATIAATVAEVPLPVPSRPTLPVAEVSTTIPAEIAQAIPLEETQPPAEPKPDWVGQPLKTTGGVTTFSVTAGPHASDELCQRDLTVVLQKAVEEYIDDYLGLPGAGRRVHLSMNYIRDQLVQEQFFETQQHSFGPMRTVHALVKIDVAAHDRIRRDHLAALTQARLGYAGGAFGLLLILLGTAFGYLKLDTATKGYYSGRLKVAATAVILTAAAAAALAVYRLDPAAQWPV